MADASRHKQIYGGRRSSSCDAYYSSDIGASILLFAIIYAFQANHSHTVVFMQEVIHSHRNIYGEFHFARTV
jgi:hypothetical protein